MAISEESNTMRYLEFKDAHSNKFWEVSVNYSIVIVRYGKLGTDGQVLSKILDSPEEAEEYAKKQVAGKLKKGYQELQKITKEENVESRGERARVSTSPEEQKNMKINFEKLKSAMDDDGDFIIDETISEDDDSDSIEEILLIRTGGGWEEEYRISVETHFVGEDDYDVVAEFGSDIEEIENAVNCYIDNGGSIETFKSWVIDKP